MNKINYVPKRLAEDFSLLIPSLSLKAQIFWDINEDLVFDRSDEKRLQDEDKFELNTPTWGLLEILPELTHLGYFLELKYNLTDKKYWVWSSKMGGNVLLDIYCSPSYIEPQLAFIDTYKHIVKKETDEN